MNKRLILIGLFGLAIATNLKAQQEVIKPTLPKWRISADAGYSIRLGTISDNLSEAQKSEVNKMRIGYNIDVAGAYIFSKDWSIGVRYNTFKSVKGSIEIKDENGMLLGNGLGQTAINFYGVTTSGQFISKNEKHLFTAGVGLGYASLEDKVTMNGISATVGGGTVGFSIDGAYDLKVAKKVAIGPRISYFGGIIKQYTGSNGQKYTLEANEREGLSRLDFSLGIRLYL